MCISHIWSRAPRPPPPPPPPKWSGKPPFSVVWVVVGLIGKPFFSCGVGSLWVGIPFPPSPPMVWGVVGGNPPSSSPLWCGVWCGVWWVGSPSLPAVVWVGGVSWWARGGREASLVRQTIFCGRRFCSETLGCPFTCFGRPWRFLLGTIQYRAIKSVLMTSRPPIIDYTLCHILYITYSRVYTIYIYKYLYTIDYTPCTWSIYKQ